MLIYVQMIRASGREFWDDYQLDSDLCIYVNLGTEPLEPVAENCWDDYQFDADLCIYVNLGTDVIRAISRELLG